MSGDFSFGWLVLPILLACSAACAASETALFSLADSDRERVGAAARRLLDDQRSTLVTLLLCNLVINVLFFAFAARLAPHAAIGADSAPGATESYGGEIAFGLGALLAILLFGEILPKSLALRAPVQIARIAAVPLSVIVAALAPVRRIVQFLLEVATRALGEVGRDESGITTESLAEVLEQSAGHGLIESSEADLLAEVIELEGIRVREIMTPRVDLLALDLSEREHKETVERALAQRLTWLPVIREHADHVVGSVRLRDILAQPERPLRELVQRVQFIPEVASVLDLLRVLRENKATEAVVVDEYGGTAGIVTIEDIFEEIVGDLRVEGELAEHPVVALGGGRFRVSGSLSIRDWNDRFGHEVVPVGFETVGGFVTALLGRIPRAGDRVRLGGLVSQVHEVRGRRVQSVDMFIEPAVEAEALIAARGGRA